MGVVQAFHVVLRGGFAFTGVVRLGIALSKKVVSHPQLT